MIFPSNLIQDAINEFAKLPGVGKKSALRHVLHLLKKDPQEVSKFTSVIQRMRDEIQFCAKCNNVSDAAICNICNSATRKQDVICVVENISHLIAIESTQHFNGLYHVLGGLISPLDGIGPDQLFIEGLINRVQSGSVQEIIMALSANIQGDTTSYFIQKKLANHSVTITTIARGVSFGGELEYTDEMTLARSIQNRLPMNSFVG
jgi:recombination protein RecR